MFDILYNAEITIAVLPQDLLFQLIEKEEVFLNTVMMLYVCTFLFLHVCEIEIKIITQMCILNT